MWVADGWKDYEVLDTSAEKSWSGGATIFWCARILR